MADNIFETNYDVTKKSKLLKFYEKNKILLFSSLFILIVLFGSYSFYIENKEKNKIKLSQNYLQAKIYLESGNKIEALKLLKKTIYENDSTYSTLSLFLIMNQNLIKDHSELYELFDHVIENNKFHKEIRNLLYYKKALFNSNFVNESQLLDSLKPLISEDTLWKPHALMLIGDYFASKNQYVKAAEFYQEIFSINNLHKDFYHRARSQLEMISNE